MKCALVGAVDFNAEHFLAEQFDYVIAVDRGYASLEAIGVKPDVSMGDFDSLGFIPKGRTVRFPSEKDKSDMELAFERAMTRKADEIYVYGALSRRLDHTLANLQLFALYSEKGPYVTGVGSDFAVRLLSGPDVFEIPESVAGGIVSVFSLDDESTGVFEVGMKYSLDDALLTNRTSLGLSNELTGEPARVGVERGTLCIFYPLPAFVE